MINDLIKLIQNLDTNCDELHVSFKEHATRKQVVQRWLELLAKHELVEKKEEVKDEQQPE